MNNNALIPVLITGRMPRRTLENILIPGFDIRHIKNPSEEELAWAEIIVGEPPVSSLKAATRLKWLQLPSSGTDAYTGSPDFPQHVLLTNATGAFGRSIAEYVFSGVFSLMRRFHLYRDCQNKCIWEWQGPEMTPRGKHVLIMGAGDIGTHTAELFHKFDCRVTGVRRTAQACPEFFDSIVTLDEAESILPEADIIICCMPDTPLTRGYFSRERLKLLKPDAIFVNVGRGSIVDTDALADVLASGSIFGAILDVTLPEPLPQDHPLWKCPNALITPHVSGRTFQGLPEKEEYFFKICRENLALYLEGKPLKNRVDLASGYRESKE